MDLRIGIDNYGLMPLGLEPLDVLRWARENGARGVQFSGLQPEQKRLVDAGYLRALREYAAAEDLYLEWGGAQHIPRDTTTWGRKDLLEINRKAAEQASLLGTRIVRSCSGGLFRWQAASPMTETLLEETAACLTSQRQMLRDHAVLLCIETHFEFTTHELRRLMERCEAEPGDWLGICLDSMNLLIMLEDPLAATERILPWVASTHIKDGGLSLTPDGLVPFPTAIGDGIVDIAAISRLLARSGSEVRLSIEDHGGHFLVPVFDPLFLSRFPDLTVQELARLLRLAQATEELQRQGRAGVTERERWPGVSEERMKANIRNLRRLVAG